MNVINYYKDDEISFHHAIDGTPDENNYPMHTHEKYELFYFIKGKGRFMIEGTEYFLEPCCLLIMRPSEAHKLYVDSAFPYERVVIEFSSSVVERIDQNLELLKAYNERPLGKNNKYDKTNFLHNLTDYISDICISDLPAETKRLNIITNLFSILNLINISFAKKVNTNIIEDANADLSKSMIEYINLHLNENLSLKCLSNHFHYSQPYLARIFKLSTGSTIADYILIKRLLEVRRKIQMGVPAGKASKECGFNDYSTFYRAYKKNFHTSPANDKK